MKKVFKSSGLIAFSSLLLLLSSNTNLIAAVNNSAPKPVSSTPADEANRLRISSDEAKYDRKNKVAMANGHVKITQDNMTIYTSSVMYNENTHTSFIDNFVRIINLDKETLNTVKLIDVLWFQKNTNNVEAAFEVEKSTSIYSGILRLSDLSYTIADGDEVFYLIQDKEVKIGGRYLRFSEP